MKLKSQSTVIALTMSCAFLALLLASCGNSTQSLKSQTHTHHVAKRAHARTATTASSAGKRDYVGAISGTNIWLGLVSDGKNVTAFATDGTQYRTATIAQWYTGTLNNNSLQASATQTLAATGIVAKTRTMRYTPGSAHVFSRSTTPSSVTSKTQGQLTAQLSQSTATGKITLSDGKSYPFIANAITNPQSKGGLYISEEIINHTKYQAGWIVPDNTVKAVSATTASANHKTTTGISENVHAATATDPNPSGGSAIINELTGKLLQAPLLSNKDLDLRRLTIPNLGIFAVHR